jgi:AcrR family transcriptional regulator
VRAARLLFGTIGYDGVTMAAVARAAGLSPTGVYHYFADKSALYRGVFDATAPLVWPGVTAAVDGATSLADAIGRMVLNWNDLEQRCPGLTPFMTGVPREAHLRDEFVVLLEQRSAWQDAAFRQLAEFGRATGELANLSATDAFEFLRASVMGWIFEGANRRQQFTEAPIALQHVIRLIASAPPTVH